MSHTIPDAPFAYRHEVPLQIRFNDIDLFGHLNNSVYVQFLDMGKLAYFKQFMKGGFEHEASVPVVANLNVTFHAPTLIDEKLSVFTQVASISKSSLVLDQRIVSSRGAVKCTATTIMVNIDPRTGESVPVSEEWRKALSEFEQREL